MQTKFGVEIHAFGGDNNALLKMIGLHNSGKQNIDLAVFEAYAIANNAQYETDNCKIKTERIDDSTLLIYSGGIHVLTIIEKTYIGSIDEENKVTNHENY